MPPRSPYEPPDTPGDVVRRARELAYLSQAQLAARVGLAASTVSRLESGARAARWDLVQALLAAMDLQPVLDYEPHDEHLRRRIQAQADLSAEDWFRDLFGDGRVALRLAETFSGAVDGTLAARLLGLPLPIDDIEVVLARRVVDSLDLETAVWAEASIALRPHEDGWRSQRPERDIVVRVVDDLPPLTRVAPCLPADLVTLAGDTVHVVALAHLRLTAAERRLFVHALRWRDDAS